MIGNDKTFGEWLRDARAAKGVTLRCLNRQLGISPSYLCDIENDRRIPAEELMHKITDSLELDFDEAMARAALLGEDTRRYLKRNPDAVALIREIARLRVQGEYCDQWRRNINESLS